MSTSIGFQYTCVNNSYVKETVIVKIRHENSSQCSLIHQSNSPPPKTNTRVPPTQLPRSNTPCFDHDLLKFSKDRAISFVVRGLFLKQTPETSFKETVRVPRQRPSSQSSRRARRNSNLHTPNAACNPCPPPSPIFDASYVFPRSRSLLHLQRDAR